MHTILRSDNLKRLQTIQNRISSFKKSIRLKAIKISTLETTRILINNLNIQPSIYTLIDGRILLVYKGNYYKASISVLENTLSFYITQDNAYMAYNSLCPLKVINNPNNTTTLEYFQNIQCHTDIIKKINRLIFELISNL